MGDIDSRRTGGGRLAWISRVRPLAFQSASGNGKFTDDLFHRTHHELGGGKLVSIGVGLFSGMKPVYTSMVLCCADRAGHGQLSNPCQSRMAYGFSIGSDHTGQNQIRGIIDEVQTYNCPLNAGSDCRRIPGHQQQYRASLYQPASQPDGGRGRYGDILRLCHWKFAINLPVAKEWPELGEWRPHFRGDLGGAHDFKCQPRRCRQLFRGGLKQPGSGGKFKPPTLALISIAITSPQAGATFSVSNLDVLGTVTSSAQIQSVTVNGTAAFLNGNAFTAWYVPLIPGTNLLVVVAQDVNGNQNQTNITVMANTNQADPLILIPSVTEGNAPLTVNFSIDSSGLPGTVQSVTWDWQV